MGERDVNTVSIRVIALFVERSSHRWVVRDSEGNFWAVPSGENGWDHRQAFFPTEETELELIPKHYAYMLNLPFFTTER